MIPAMLALLVFLWLYFNLFRMDVCLPTVSKKQSKAHVDNNNKNQVKSKKFLHVRTHNFLKHLLNVSQIIK